MSACLGLQPCSFTLMPVTVGAAGDGRTGHVDGKIWINYMNTIEVATRPAEGREKGKTIRDSLGEKVVVVVRR